MAGQQDSYGRTVMVGQSQFSVSVSVSVSVSIFSARINCQCQCQFSLSPAQESRGTPGPWDRQFTGPRDRATHSPGESSDGYQMIHLASDQGDTHVPKDRGPTLSWS
jgi:hypothetical protein